MRDETHFGVIGLEVPSIASSGAIEKLAGQPVGRRLKIVNFALPLDIYQRLLELGLTIGSECRVVRYAPLGDPMEVRVRGYGLSLRASEAEGIRVQGLS